MKQTDNVVLIGFMGTGKSTVGRRLAERLGWGLIDTDQWIEAKEGISIATMFRTKGEAYFRAAETNALKKILQHKKQVVASGGGAVLAAENRKIMLSHALVVALHADIKTIVNRVSRDRNRPLLQGNVHQKVVQLLEQRKGAYDFGHVQIDTSTSSIEDTVEEIVAHIVSSMR